jgi:Protein of unknown function (DUF3102)
MTPDSGRAASGQNATPRLPEYRDQRFGENTATERSTQDAGRAAWAVRIESAWRGAVEGVLETGRLLTEAKAALPHGAFTAMIETDLPFKPSTAQRLMRIAADERLSNPAHVQHLPPHWGTLYELTKLSNEQFEAGLASGGIHPRWSAETLLAPRNGSDARRARSNWPRFRSPCRRSATA